MALAPVALPPLKLIGLDTCVYEPQVSDKTNAPEPVLHNTSAFASVAINGTDKAITVVNDRANLPRLKPCPFAKLPPANLAKNAPPKLPPKPFVTAFSPLWLLAISLTTFSPREPFLSLKILFIRFPLCEFTYLLLELFLKSNKSLNYTII